MSSNPSRLARLRSIYGNMARQGAAVVSFAALSVQARADDRDAQHRFSTLRAERSRAMNDTTDEDEATPSALAMADETTPRRMLAGESVLTAAERRQLLVEWQPTPKPAPVAALDPLDEPLPADFVPAPVEEFDSLFGGEIDRHARAQAAAEAAFELDVEAAPLMLTA